MSRLVVLFCLAALSLLSLTACDFSDSSDTASAAIKDALYEITLGFSQHDINRIMQHVHPNYRHRGDVLFNCREDWLDRMAGYQLISFDGIVVSVQEDYATASFIMRLTNNDGTDSSYEPETNGDCSYFFYEDGEWLICGNEFIPTHK